MNSPHHQHHEHHDVHQQRLLWFFSFCNQRSSSSSSSSSGSTTTTTTNRRSGSGRRKSGANSRNKFAAQYQQQLQQQQRQSSNVFGRELIEHTQFFSDDDSIPHIVKSCTRFIEKHGIIFGIYRLSGMRVNIHKLRQDFDKNPKISMIDSEAISNDAHAVACVLKQYFRELPTPLLTFHMYEKFIELFKHNNNEANITNNNNPNPLDTNDIRIIDTIDDQQQQQQQDPDTAAVNVDGDEIIHDNNNTSCGGVAKTIVATPTTINTNPNATITKTSMTTKPLESSQQSTAAIVTTQTTQIKQQQQQFTTSASDSQLISLSSVVTTTTSDIKYQVKLGDLRRLLLQLPRAHYQTLKFLMCHLACIAANGKKTGMDSKNVAIVWAPNLLKPRELELSAGLETLQIIGLQAVITEQLIKHHKFLFEDENDFVTNTTTTTTTTTATTTTTTKPFSDRDDTTKVFRPDNIDDEDLENRHRHHNMPPSSRQQQQEPVHRDQEQLAKERTDEQHHPSKVNEEMRDENEENNFSECK